jgi:ribose-phosphate pyrophosphokinase
VGGALSVSACASHGVLSGPALKRIEESVLDEVVFLDTIPARADMAQITNKIKYLTVSDMFAEAIDRIYEEISVSKLFV